MAHSLSAKKRVRQNIKRNARNRARKEVIKSTTKAFMTAVTAGDVKAAATELTKVVQKLDRTAAKNTIHKNTAARKRSRLTRKLNALTKAAGAPAVAAPAKAPKKAPAKKGAGTKAAKA